MANFSQTIIHQCFLSCRKLAREQADGWAPQIFTVIPLKQAWTPVIYKTNKTNFRISCYVFLFSGLFWSFDLLLNFWARHMGLY
jgi:hypothetical protein